MKPKRVVTRHLVITSLFLLLLPLDVLAGLHLQFGVEPSYTLAFANPAKGYYRDLNEDFKVGIYTWKIPFPGWKKIEMPNFNEFGVEGSCLVKLKSGKIKNPRVGFFVGYRGSRSTSNYNQNYENVYDPFTKEVGDFKFNRQENISIDTLSFGQKAKIGLTDKLDFSTTFGIDFHKVKGNVDYTRKTMFSWYPKEHVDQRTADYEGNGTGFSIGGGLDYKVLENILLGVALGYRTGKVQTKGKEVKTSSTNPGMSWTRDYSPKFNFNSPYGKFYIGMSF